MTFDAQAARFFAANDDRFAFHQRADVFEADGRLINFHAKQFRDRVHLMARRHGAHDRARPPAILFQMIQRERQNLVRRQPRSVLVHNAKTIRVAIETKPHLRLAAADEFAHVGHVLRVRFGMMPAEQRIQFVVKQRDLRADFFEQHIEITVASAVTQINGDFQFRFFKN